MSTYELQLSIDFGEVGYWNSKEPFKVGLDASPLTKLIGDATNAFRLYELLLIRRPGDVWDYVTVTPEVVPNRVARRIAEARQEAMPLFADQHPWPEGQLPFPVFDKLFFWQWDDTDPEDEAWLSHRGSSVMDRFATQLLGLVNSAKARLNWNDALLKHIIHLIETGKHEFDTLSRTSAIAADDSYGPGEDQHTTEFYKKLDDVLTDKELVSVAYRSDGDYRVLRSMATEQRRRANITGHQSGNSLYLSALVNRTISNVAWDSEIHLFSEGLAHGDLYIQGPGIDSNSIKELIETHHRASPGRHILSYRDEGEIAGYTKECGNGWWLYQKEVPEDRRRCLQRSRSNMGQSNPVLAFELVGNTIFSHEKAVIIVGPEISNETQVSLSRIITDWKTIGSKPLVIALGDCGPLAEIPGGLLVQSPDASVLAGEEARYRWLRAVIGEHARWIDVLMLLDVPRWVEETLAWEVENGHGPWKTLVVATPGLAKMKAGVTLSNDLGNEFDTAHNRALNMRPRSY